MSRDNSSPRSLNTEEGSNFVSPNSTVPTNYSPAEMRNYSSTLLNQLHRDHLSPLADRFAQATFTERPAAVLISKRPAAPSGLDDPFTSGRLSATAEPYMPFIKPAPILHSPIRELSEGSTPERAPRARQLSLINSVAIAFDNRMQHADVPVSPRRLKLQSKLGFTSDPDDGSGLQPSRYLALEGLDATDADERVQGSKLTQFRMTGLMENSISMKKSPIGLIFRFDHLDDAKDAIKAASIVLCDSYPTWTMRFVKATNFHGSDSLRQFEGQVNIKLTSSIGIDFCTQNSDELRQIIQTVVHEAGDIVAWKVQNDDPEMFLMRIELASCDAADNLIRKRGLRSPIPGHPGLEIAVSSLYGTAPAPSSTNTSPIARRDSAFEHAYQMSIGSTMTNGMYPYTSPLAHRTSRTFDQGYMARQDKSNTQVIPERIRSGDDVRTTVMIRNIPNKVDAEEFKKILNNAAFGKYDFSYLRIDFQNMCNVGYAFVNFTEAEHIILLYDEIVGKRWNIFNSDKIAEMCYATIQGLDCCIDKFRNSSVMLEWGPHRPKLWFTENDGSELCGLEREFPGPTNLQKLQRSKDNAAEIGLYPPRGTNGFRHENRHHVSMFDRGHPRAIEDERHHLPAHAVVPHHLSQFGQIFRPEQFWGAGYPPAYGGPLGYGAGYPPLMYGARQSPIGLGISDTY